MLPALGARAATAVRDADRARGLAAAQVAGDDPALDERGAPPRDAVVVPPEGAHPAGDRRVGRHVDALPSVATESAIARPHERRAGDRHLVLRDTARLGALT